MVLSLSLKKFYQSISKMGKLLIICKKMIINLAMTVISHMSTIKLTLDNQFPITSKPHNFQPLPTSTEPSSLD
jgi:hypothetical protein